MQLLEVEVRADSGLHARPAANLVHTALGFKSDITVVKGGKRANAKSMLSLLALGVHAGDSVAFQVDGIDEAEAVAAISQLAGNNFDDSVKRGM